MNKKHVGLEELGLLQRSDSRENIGADDLEHTASFELEDLPGDSTSTDDFSTSLSPRWLFRAQRQQRRHFRRARSFSYQSCKILALILYVALGSIVICGTFFPSYSNPPERYVNLRKEAEKTGTANKNNEKVFIAASLYDKDGELLSGHWGRSVLGLIKILGPENVFLSIYENDPSEVGKQALTEFESRISCNSSLIHEHLDLTNMPHVTTAEGTTRLKRIAYLAHLRNRALKPLEDSTSPAYRTRFNKLLYLNDVVFDSIDAANLLFSTRQDERTGQTDYRAACAVDFINPFKFYDTFATRDLEGNDMGVPFFPWFTSAGSGESRKDVLAQMDAVRVKSCWGGMAAFEAKWFQPRLHMEPMDPSSVDITPNVDLSVSTSPVDDGTPMWHSGSLQKYNLSNPIHMLPSNSLGSRSYNATYLPLHFRAETDTYWDSSECCLIHADLTALSASDLEPGHTGIYMNPYIRVAYSRFTFTSLHFTKRFERLYTPVHAFVNWIATRPSFNPRRLQQPGEEVVDKVWMWDEFSMKALSNGTVNTLTDGLEGGFQDVKRTALPGGFCGKKKLMFIRENHWEGEKGWGSENPPMLE